MHGYFVQEQAEKIGKMNCKTNARNEVLIHFSLPSFENTHNLRTVQQKHDISKQNLSVTGSDNSRFLVYSNGYWRIFELDNLKTRCVLYLHVIHTVQPTGFWKVFFIQ